MNRKEYKEITEYELYGNKKTSLLNRIRIRYFQPNTNCMYLARRMWFFYSQGGVYKYFAKIIYLKILHRYGCIIFPSAKIDKGFHITHPVGIVIGNCVIGKNFMIYQNCTIGSRVAGEGYPTVGNNVELCANSLILGNIEICDDCTIGASSLVIKTISSPGVYVGTPARLVEK